LRIEVLHGAILGGGEVDIGRAVPLKKRRAAERRLVREIFHEEGLTETQGVPAIALRPVAAGVNLLRRDEKRHAGLGLERGQPGGAGGLAANDEADEIKLEAGGRNAGAECAHRLRDGLEIEIGGARRLWRGFGRVVRADGAGLPEQQMKFRQRERAQREFGHDRGTLAARAAAPKQKSGEEKATQPPASPFGSATFVRVHP
jgi:hypothetical protein